MKAYGKIIAAEEKKSGISKRTGNPWASQVFVLETIEQYPKKIPFELSGGFLDKFNVQVGETLTIDFDVDGSEYNGRWYPKIRCFNVVRGEGGGQQQGTAQAAPAQPQSQQPAQQAAPAPAAQAPVPDPLESQGGADKDDLPF